MPPEPSIACLPMYDWPEVQSAWDNVWTHWHAHYETLGLKPPRCLTRFSAADFKRSWTAENLFLTQCCALPYLKDHREHLRAFAAFDLNIEGFEGDGIHRSLLVVRADDPRTSLAELRDARWVMNSSCSQTGRNSLRMTVPQWPYFTQAEIYSGGHRQSASMVAEGRADFAAIDAVSWWLFQRYEPQQARCLRVLGHTAAFPSLPLCRLSALPLPLPLPPSVSVEGLPEIKLTEMREGGLPQRNSDLTR